MHDTYEVGDTVIYRTFMGGTLRGRVIEKHDNINDGKPGFDMIDDRGETWWGYSDQIDCVISAKSQIPLVRF